MASFDYIGQVDSLSERQFEYISGVLQDLGYKDEQVSVGQVGKKGDNYVANVVRLVIEKKDGGIFKIVVKVAPRHQVVRMMMHTISMFSNEVLMYTEVLPKFLELQKKAGFPEEELLKFAKCYGTLLEQPEELILLEDLNVHHYGILDRLTPLANDSIKLVLKNLANLHSSSYFLKKVNRDLYNEYATKLVNTWLLLDKFPDAKKHFETHEQDIHSLISDERCKSIIPGKLANMTSYMSERYNPEQDTTYFVIQQGDCWTNNLLFKTEEGKSVDSIMIDYQLSKQSSPVDDFLYLLFNCTDYETRKTNYQDWVEYYYNELTKCLARYGLDAQTTYPKTEMLSDMKRNSKFVLSQGLLLATVLVREQVDTFDFKEKIMENENDPTTNNDEYRITLLSQKSLDRLRSRIKGLVDTYVELGFSDNGVQ